MDKKVLIFHQNDAFFAMTLESNIKQLNALTSVTKISLNKYENTIVINDIIQNNKPLLCIFLINKYNINIYDLINTNYSKNNQILFLFISDSTFPNHPINEWTKYMTIDEYSSKTNLFRTYLAASLGISGIDMDDRTQIAYSLRNTDYVLNDIGLDEYKIVKRNGTRKQTWRPSKKITEFLDILESAIFMANDNEYLKENYIDHISSNTDNVEAESDTQIFTQAFNKDYNEDLYLESMHEFHENLINPNKITYFLVGHRGTGKSAFIHYYFRCFPKFIKTNYPYMIVNFMNFGFVKSKNNIRDKILYPIYKFITSHNSENIANLQIKDYTELESLVTAEKIFETLKQKSISKKIVYGDMKLYEIRSFLNEIDKTNIGKQLLKNPENLVEKSLSNKDPMEYERQYFENSIWDWLLAATRYVSSYSAHKVRSHLLEWIKVEGFRSKGSMYCSSQWFVHNMSYWKDRNKDELDIIEELSDERVTSLLKNFLEHVDKHLIGKQKLVLILDNMDLLSAQYSESIVLDEIRRVVCYQYHSLKLISILRPSTAIGHRKKIQDIGRFYIKIIGKVKFSEMVNRRLDNYINHNEINSNDFNIVHDILKLPICKTNRDQNPTDFDSLISGIAGYNHRDAIMLFKGLFTSAFCSLDKDVIRNPHNRGKYIAEHMLIRSLFLEGPTYTDFKEGIVNLFEIPRAQSHNRLLLQCRILEIINAQKHYPKEELFEILYGLGYAKEVINLAIENLTVNRLISTYHSSEGPEEIFARYRGHYYMEHLIRKLGYIQMTYFMSHIPKNLSCNFSYPEIPKVKELSEIVSNFLEILWLEISNEREKGAEEFINKYEFLIGNRNLESLHSVISEVYQDLRFINHSKG
ncbi:MAG: hypothetical protein JEZ07_17745 [Phycisphaerae bacterium]|nr:hypothetical protein [Phycisphaerae bacterium]